MGMVYDEMLYGIHPRCKKLLRRINCDSPNGDFRCNEVSLQPTIKQIAELRKKFSKESKSGGSEQIVNLRVSELPEVRVMKMSFATKMKRMKTVKRRYTNDLTTCPKCNMMYDLEVVNHEKYDCPALAGDLVFGPGEVKPRGITEFHKRQETYYKLKHRAKRKKLDEGLDEEPPQGGPDGSTIMNRCARNGGGSG